MKYLVAFTYKQISCCLFPALLFASLAVTKVVHVPGVYRYDLLLYIAILIQIILIKTGYESWEEVRIIFLFHIVGLGLEIFKIHIGAWSYPEAGIWKAWDVPLYSGFMYSSVGSYIYRAWKVLQLEFENWPNKWVTGLLCLAIYGNFFTHHYMWDIRYLLIFWILFLFRRTNVHFGLLEKRFYMNASVAFLLIGICMWIAENIASFFGAWIYPNQEAGWHLVHLGKISSWSLLIILSISLVYYARNAKARGGNQYERGTSLFTGIKKIFAKRSMD